MKTIVEALQNLYVALGGKSSDVADLVLNPDVIDQITELVSGGALKELPSVSADDNGDVLTVIDGEWEAAAPGGGGGGLTLYGPYVFTSSTPVTIGASQTQSISLSEITRFEDQVSVTLESDSPFAFLLAGYSISQDCKLTGIDPTDYYQGECTPPQIWLYNDGDSSVSVSGNTLMAYLTIELPTAN